MPRLTYDLPPLGGLKKDIPAHLLQREASHSLNGVWPFNGKIRRIPGKGQLSTVALDTSGGVMEMKLFELYDGSEYLVACTQDKSYKYNAASGTFDSIHTGSNFSGGDSAFFDMAPFFDSAGAEILVITNGVDELKKWTGTGTIAALGGSPDKCKYLEVYQNYLFRANMQSSPADPRQMQYSAIGNGESHPAENFVDLKVTTDAIVRPRLLRDSMVIYKERSVSVLDYVGGDLVFRLRENYLSGLGLLASKSVQSIGMGAEAHYFIGSDNEIHTFDLIERGDIGANISPLLQNLDPTTWAGICSVKTDEYDKVIWAIPGRGQTGNQDLLIYDIKTRSWWVHEGEANRIFSMIEGRRVSGLTWDTLPYSTWDTFDVPGGWDALGASDNSTLIMFGCADGKVRYWVAGEDDDGTALDSHYTYPFDNLDGDEETIKHLTKIVLEVANEGSETITVEVFTDSNDQNAVALDEDGNTSKSAALSATDTNKTWIRHEIDVAVQGYNFSVKLSSSGGVWSGRLLALEYVVIGKRVL
jgi:hypothetical protein